MANKWTDQSYHAVRKSEGCREIRIWIDQSTHGIAREKLRQIVKLADHNQLPDLLDGLLNDLKKVQTQLS